MIRPKRLVEVLHREIPIARPVLFDDKLDLVHRRPPPRYPAAAAIDQTLRTLGLIALAAQAATRTDGAKRAKSDAR